MGELARHLDHVHLAVADDAQVLDQALGVNHLAATHDLRQAGVEAGVAQAHGRRGWRRDHDAGGASGNLPQSSGARFLDLGMRRLVLEGQHIVSGQADDGVGRERRRSARQASERPAATRRSRDCRKRSRPAAARRRDAAESRKELCRLG